MTPPVRLRLPGTTRPRLNVADAWSTAIRIMTSPRAQSIGSKRSWRVVGRGAASVVTRGMLGAIVREVDEAEPLASPRLVQPHVTRWSTLPRR